MDTLSTKNKHPFDSRIKFQEEGHKYWIDGDSTGLISVTTFIHTFFDKFDADKIIKYIINSKKYNDPSYIYYKKSADDIKQKWENESKLAMNEGTKLHKDIENFYNTMETDGQVEIENDSIEFNHFLKFYEDHEELEVYRTEWMIFSDILKITGSIDMVFLNKDGTIIIADWKRSKLISYEAFGNKCGKYPLEHIPDCNYYHYSLQLNLYRVILEKFYNIQTNDMFLVILHPSNQSYEKIPILRMDNEIELILNFRRKELIKRIQMNLIL